MKEIELFEPLRAYLQGQGYSVYSEVKNCDLVARKGEDTLFFELKTRMSLALIAQGVRRQELDDSVYLVVPLKSSSEYPPNYKNIKLLLKRLGLGLVLIRFLKHKTRVETVLHPADFEPRRRHRKRAMVLAEVDGRYAEFNKAGEASTVEKITAYKQRALLLLDFLKEHQAVSPKELRQAGFREDSGAVLSQNYYGWFQRLQRGVYGLSQAGEEAWSHYQENIDVIKKARR